MSCVVTKINVWKLLLVRCYIASNINAYTIYIYINKHTNIPNANVIVGNTIQGKTETHKPNKCQILPNVNLETCGAHFPCLRTMTISKYSIEIALALALSLHHRLFTFLMLDGSLSLSLLSNYLKKIFRPKTFRIW